ncbi:hypothetical protein POM88_032731 [Heracleum sosnowskyi]|uniref:Arf-GAP domain-containing protein n=1 Tax=Heracleum sosnowskyi TaxID=360622 RepID=A0AAD8I0Q9_9APIA|nr:hypothetical protein POM88_032731 [Heracleum sosnowskyi]
MYNFNCSQGPQYVCTTFWTFVCITCSGIHREFTHRVKSVSMSFTSQEVEALQKGACKGTYIERKTRYSVLHQFPVFRTPFCIVNMMIYRYYWFLLYNKEFDGFCVTNGSGVIVEAQDANTEALVQFKSSLANADEALSDCKCRGSLISSFLSPSHSSDNGFEGSFSNEGSNASDICKYETQAPTFQTGFGFSSASSESARDVFNEEISQHNVNTYSDAHTKSAAEQVPHSQDDNEVAILVNTAYLYGSDTKNKSPGVMFSDTRFIFAVMLANEYMKKRLLKSQISLTEDKRRKRNITLLVKEVMGELEFVVEEDAP